MNDININDMNNKEMKGSFPAFLDDDVFSKDDFVSCTKQVKNIHHLWLIDEVGEPKQYLKWFDTLQNATEEDIIVLHVNSYGGYIDTAVQIITAIKTSQAKVICQIEAACCSAATIIALSCDGLICFPHSYMMIHTSSGCVFGKQSDIKVQESFYNGWLNHLFDEVYMDFLTEKEIESVLGGHDIWLDAEEVMSRFKHRVDIINKENAKKEKKEREHMRKLNSFMSTLQNGEVESTNQERESSEGKKTSGKTKKSSKKKSTKTKKVN